MKRGEIYYCNSLPGCIGSEQIGRRPVLIVQNDKGNKFSPTTMVASITTDTRRYDMPTHVTITDILPKASMIMME